MKRGRKSKYSEELHTKILNYLDNGVTVKDCCALCGISQDTFFEWCKTIPEFAETTTRARANARLMAVLVIQEAVGEKDIDSAKWLLERTDPENWGRKDKLILEVEPALLRRFKAAADAAEIDLSSLFEDLINELGSKLHTDS